MRLIIQKRLAGQILKCSEKRIWLDQTRLEEIKEAITKADIRKLIKDHAIKEKPIKGISKGRARKKAIQKSKGRQKGVGSRKGRKKARLPKKIAWMSKIRAQRTLLKNLKTKKKIDNSTYKSLYTKSKGGFFRSRRHIKLYLEEHGLLK